VSVQHHDNEAIRNHAAFIWSVADLLRGDYKQSEYGRVIQPLVVCASFSEDGFAA
jgi:type I restriction-modification system DNA methylase subunit